MSNHKELNYSDVYLLPQYSEVASRNDVDVSVALGTRRFILPVIPANMRPVIDCGLCEILAKKGYLYSMHRFGTDLVQFAESMLEKGAYVSVSVGVNEKSMEAIDNASKRGLSIDYITIDVAHGHSLKVKQMIKYVKHKFNNAFLIAGNVCTRWAVKDLQEWGADCIKVGIACGHVCTTRQMTGFSRPQFSAVMDCATGSKVPIIADGGIQYNGDIAKALVAGATMVMVGNVLAGFEESPGEKIIHEDGRITKEYYGSSSEFNTKGKEYIEGRRIEIPYRGSIWNKLNEIEQSLRSSISYAGGNDLEALREVAWVTS